MRYRSVIAALLFSAGMINHIDRSALSIAAPLVARDLHLRPGALGVVFGSFFAGYAAFCFIGGYAADRRGPKRTFALAMGFWSLFCGLTASVGSVGGFVHLPANLAGIVGPIATGFIVQATGSFSVAFVLAGSLAVVGMLSLLFPVREPMAAIGAGQPFSDPATI